MRNINELVVRGQRPDLESFLERLSDSLPSEWSRDRAAEERARGWGGTASGSRALCFARSESPGRPAVALWLKPRSLDEWSVSSVVPLRQRDLTDEEYNQALGDFKSECVDSLSGGGVCAQVMPYRKRIEDYLSPEGCQRFHDFSALANRVKLEPSDLFRWHAFAIEAHRDHAVLDPSDLEDWLAAEDWSPTQREELVRGYEWARVLLAQYDEEEAEIAGA